MDSPQMNLAVDELVFSLFQRPLHPELFQVFSERRIRTDKYEAVIWATGCTHVISVFAKGLCLTELINSPSIQHRNFAARLAVDSKAG